MRGWLCLIAWLISPGGWAGEYVGAEACQSCHPQQVARWQGSHHARAMGLPTPAMVLGDFDNAEFSYFGQRSRFFRDGERYLVETDGVDGRLQRFEVAYTFGFFPLQQYLLALPGGRYQALSIAWDSRPAAEGGQRWFHLYPDTPIEAGDPLHWTGPYQNWNSRCAHCHSTALEKRYDPESDSYATRWAALNVSCEACHGPASEHLRWAEQPKEERGADHGLTPPAPDAGGQMAVCAGCHSRRGLLAEGATAASDFHDHFRLRLPEAPLYHPDGQIRDEVFVYGSFLQSKMHRRGVRCGDCHDAHSLQLRAAGNSLCTRCHAAERFDGAEHHRHAADSPGALCANCHMPATTYMGVDARRDHSLRIPRPDLSPSLGTPNPCQTCHPKRSPEWAGEVLNGWLAAQGRKLAPHYGETLSAPEPLGLRRLADDPEQGAIVRATAYSALASQLDAAGLAQLTEALADPEPLVRSGAVTALAELPMPQRVRLLFPLLEDPKRMIRLQVFEAMLALPESGVPVVLRGTLQRVEQEYRVALWLNADTPEGRLKLGDYYRARGDEAQAEAHYRRALTLNPQLLAALINLADLHRRQGRDDAAQPLLERAVDLAPDEPGAHYALGMLRIRQKAYLAAAGHLERAAALAPGNWHYGYTQALALDAGGRTAAAESLLQTLLQRFPDALPVLEALLEFARRQGDSARALAYAEQLLARQPDNLALRRWVERLKQP